jgi:hypothetical protein
MKNKFLCTVAALAFAALANVASFAQGGPGGGPGSVPSPWTVNGSSISYSGGGVLLPSSVTGGNEGVGSINVSGGYFVNGVPLGSLPCSDCALKSQPLSQFASTTSAQLRGVISDETGSGLAVFNSAPTLISPVIITTFTATGLVKNADLINSSITIGSTSVSLGATASTIAGLTLTAPVLGVAAGTSIALNGCSIGTNTLCITGTAAISSTLSSAAHAITSASASAFAVGLNGATNPVLQIDASTALQTGGIKIIGGAGTGASIAVIDSVANSPISLNAKGSGNIAIGNISTGGVSITGATVNMSAAAQALAVGANGATNPVLNVDASASSVATGISIKGLATTSGVAITATDSGTNTPISINSKGSGAIVIGNVSTGATQIGAGGGGLTVTNSFTATGLVTFADMATAAIATQSNYFAGAASVIVPASQIYQPEITVTFGATTTFDFNTFINAVETLTANVTTQTLTNVAAGKAGSITLIQDATGSRTSVFNTIFKFSGGVVPTLSTAANAVDVLFYSCRTATNCPASLAKDVR